MSVDAILVRELQEAADCINTGNLVLGEIICRQILSRLPMCAQALAMLGIIAAQLNLRDQAIAYMQMALSCDPTLASVQRHLNQIQSMPVQRFDQWPGRGDRFLLIKAWGYGFWADVTSVLGALLLAEITGRIPVTSWGDNSHYSSNPNADAFQSYFKPVSTTDCGALLKMKSATIFPPKWTSANLESNNVTKSFGSFSRMSGIYFLNRPENIAVSDFYISVMDMAPWIPVTHPLYGKSIDELFGYLIAKYIHPKPHILKAVEKFERSHIRGIPTVAVHIRGSDKYVDQQSINDVNRNYFSLIDRLDKTWKILLLTDDTRLVDKFRQTYSNRIVLTEAQRSSNQTGIHYVGDRNSLGFEIMRDTYLALRCQKFIGNGQSTVSAMIAILKQWKLDDCILLSPSLLYKQNDFLYRPQFPG